MGKKCYRMHSLYIPSLWLLVKKTTKVRYKASEWTDIYGLHATNIRVLSLLDKVCFVSKYHCLNIQFSFFSSDNSWIVFLFISYQNYNKIGHSNGFFSMGYTWPLLFIFVLFKQFTENCRLQWDSNSDRRYRRQARWPLDHNNGPTLV